MKTKKIQFGVVVGPYMRLGVRKRFVFLFDRYHQSGNVGIETSARIPPGTQEASAPKNVDEDKRHLQKVLSIEDTEGKKWEAKSRRRAFFLFDAYFF